MTKCITLALSAMVALMGRPARGQGLTFPSAQAATQALVVAIQSDDRTRLKQILGLSDELLQPDDSIEGGRRQKFLEKYHEMHRLVRKTNGTMVLYVGAENWPFPEPLAMMNGAWQFDAKRGRAEILYRHIGENEMTAIEVSHRLVAGTADASATNGPYHGYAFRALPGSDKAFVAYPTEYGSSGVMTFIVDSSDVVYEKDLGPRSADSAQAMPAFRPDKTWRQSE